MASRAGGRALQPQARCDSVLRGTSPWATFPTCRPLPHTPTGGALALCQVVGVLTLGVQACDSLGTAL